MPTAAPPPVTGAAGATPARPAGATRTPNRNRSRWAGVAVFGFFAMWATLMIVVSTVKAHGRDGNDAQSLSSRALGEAMRDVPFTVRLPVRLPDDAKLVRVFLDKPDYKQGFQTYTLNTYYSVPGRGGTAGHSVHVWQTNDPFLARSPGGDPTTRGVPERIAGRTWTRVVDDRLRDHAPVTAFSTRYADEVTVAIDATNPDDARATIRTLEEMGKGALPGGITRAEYERVLASSSPAK